MQQFLDLIRGIDPLLFNALAFLVGLIAGHWIALGRDKRQEFNAAVKPIREGIINADRMPSETEIDYIAQYMSIFKRRSLRNAINRCDKKREEQTAHDPLYGSIVYKDYEGFRKTAKEVLVHLNYR
ncbi:MAG: hypothetical protein KF686_01130 [Ramlibacter sp.]|nr:hypothetical protein [Ramlibacter sp.]